MIRPFRWPAPTYTGAKPPPQPVRRLRRWPLLPPQPRRSHRSPWMT
jgi:hypothetical protein